MIAVMKVNQDIIMKPDWTATFLSMTRGEKRRYTADRIGIETARTLAGRCKNVFGTVFRVRRDDTQGSSFTIERVK